MRPTGLRGTQFALLVHTYAMGPISLSKLADAMATDRTTLTRNLELLEKNALVRVEDGDDRRTRIVSITDDGRKRLARAFPYWKKTQDEIKKMMGLDDWSAMISRVSRMVNQVQER
jgi:DNA-binding MarR family transcriptional regulator